MEKTKYLVREKDSTFEEALSCYASLYDAHDTLEEAAQYIEDNPDDNLDRIVFKVTVEEVLS